MTIVSFFETVLPSSLLILETTQVSDNDVGVPELVVAVPAILVRVAGASAFMLKVYSSTIDPVVETLFSIVAGPAFSVK